MTIPEILGWVRSILEMLGIYNFIPAGVLVIVAIVVVRWLFSGGD